MSPRSKTSKAFLILFAFSLTISTVSAQAPDIEVYPEDRVLWEQSYDHELNFDVKCTTEGNFKSADLRFAPLDNKLKSWDKMENPFSWPFSFDRTGSYVIEANCGNEDNSTQITLDSMDIDVEGISRNEDWYVGENRRIKLRISSAEGSFEPNQISYLSVEVGNKTVVGKSDDFSREMTLGISGDELEGILDENEQSGSIPVDVNLYYERYPGSQEKFGINVTEKMVDLHKWKVTNVDVSPDRSVTSSQFNQLGLTADIYYKGSPINQESDSFGPENFYLKGYSQDKDGSQWFNGELVNQDNGRYSISLGPTPQELESTMTVVFDSDLSSGPVKVADIRIEDIQKYIWNAKVLNSAQSAVEADFRVNYENSYVNFTSTNGDFSEKIRPGTHNIDVEFPTSRLSLSEVTLNEGNSGRNIIYNYMYYSDISDLQRADSLKGIKPVNLASYSFAYPLSGGKLAMRYNNEQIDSAESVKVYECTQWHFGDKECRASEGWKQVDNVQTIPASWKSTKYSTARFNIDTHNWDNEGEILQNAYIVGTSADLLLNNGISVTGTDQGRVETGGDVEVSGRIVSENGNFVEGASVEVSFYEGSDEVASLDEAETGSEGRFSVQGSAPDTPGNYTVRLQASADNYNDLDTRFEDRFETFIAEGVSLKTDSPVEVTLGQETSTMVEVVNTGQTEMQNVQLSFSGLNSDFYTVSRKSFGSIAAGESATAQVTFNIPESYGVDDYPQMDVEVSAQNSEGEEFTDSDSIQTQLSYGSGQTGSADSETAKAPEESSSFSTDKVANMTGEFLDSQSSLNIALGLILIFLMALAGAMKKKKEEDDQDRRRGGRPAVQKPSLQGTDERPGKQEDEGDDVDSQIDEIADAFNGEEGEEDEELEEVVEETVEDDQEKELPEDRIDESAGEEEAREDLGDEESGEDSEGSFECETCGETFDSESGRDLHQSVMHE